MIGYSTVESLLQGKKSVIPSVIGLREMFWDPQGNSSAGKSRDD